MTTSGTGFGKQFGRRRNWWAFELQNVKGYACLLAGGGRLCEGRRFVKVIHQDTCGRVDSYPG